MEPENKLDLDGYDRRVFDQIGVLFEELETAKKLPMKDRIATLIAICRMQTYLRKERKDDRPAAGSAVRKYASAFAANAGRGRKAAARPTQDFDLDDDEDALPGRA